MHIRHSAHYTAACQHPILLPGGRPAGLILAGAATLHTPHMFVPGQLLLTLLALRCRVCAACTLFQVADLRASYSLVLQAVSSNAKLVAWHRCRQQNAPVVATAAALAMAEQQGGQDIDADSIITAQVGGVLHSTFLLADVTQRACYLAAQRFCLLGHRSLGTHAKTAKRATQNALKHDSPLQVEVQEAKQALARQLVELDGGFVPTTDYTVSGAMGRGCCACACACVLKCLECLCQL